MAKNAPITITSGSTVLTSSYELVGGAATSGAVAVINASAVMVSIDYTRHGSSTTGRPIVQLEFSGDAPSTTDTAVAHWSPDLVPDPVAANFTAGAVEFYPRQVKCNPSAPGTQTFDLDDADTLTKPWLRVKIKDVDGSNPGTVTAVRLSLALS